jgi:CheY-like chemotaxis protein
MDMRCVLVVDDDPGIRGIAKFILADAGYDVLLAENGREAIKVLESSTVSSPTVLVMDLQMPVMDGRQLFLELDTRHERPPCVVCSAFEAEKTRQELGAEKSLLKPFDPCALVQAVAELTPY